jgi:tRNA threonylcarbamoyladenosine biosynthesis protein TsaE
MPSTSSAAETEAQGAALAEQLRPGDLVLVFGEIGAGKTTFVRGACRALGVTAPVTSPTFTIGRRYEGGRWPISHLDLHRLGGLDGEDPALLDDYVGPDRVAFVEWPEIASSELDRTATWEVRLRHGGSERRELEVRRRLAGAGGLT